MEDRGDQGTLALNQYNQDKYEWTDIKLTFICTISSFRAKRRSGHLAPSLTQKQYSVNNHLQMKTYFSKVFPHIRVDNIP